MQKKAMQFIKRPFSCGRESASSTSLTSTVRISSEQRATITTSKQDISPAAIESPEESDVSTTAAPSDDTVDASATRKKFWRRDTPTSTASTEEVGAWLTTEELWGKLLKTGLEKKKLERLSCLMCTRYEKKVDTRFLRTLKPVMEWLLVFNKSAKSTYSVSSSIQSLLNGLEIMLPRLKEYVDLYSDNERLRKIFCDMCAVYVEACIRAVLYLERRALKNLFRELCLACRDGRLFADAMNKLENHERAFIYEADLASARHMKDIHTAQPFYFATLGDKIQDTMQVDPFLILPTPSVSDYDVDSGINRAETIAGSPGEIVQRLDKARDAIAEILKENHIVGLASHVIFKGEIIWTANMGYRDMDQKKPVDSETIFPIGALSQGFTAACVAQQVYRKGLSYDNKISDFLPQVNNSDATVGDLLGHRTGLQTSDHWPHLSHVGGFPCKVNDRTIIPTYNNLGPRATLRSQFLHNGIGYALLGKIVSPKYADYLKENVLRPLQMSRTRVALDEESDIEYNTSRRYSVGVNGQLFVHVRNCGSTAYRHNLMPSVAVGSMMSTTNDLAKYCIALNQAWKRQHHTEDVEIQTLRHKQVFPDVDLLFNPLQAIGAGEKANKSHAAGWATCTLPAVIGDIGANPELMKTQMPELGTGSAPVTLIWNQSRYHGTHGFVGLLPEYEAAVIVLSNTTTGDDTPDWIGQLLIQATLGNPYKNSYAFLAGISARNARQEYFELAEKLQQGRQTKGPTRSLSDYDGEYESVVSGQSVTIWKRSFFSRHLGKEERDEDKRGQRRKRSPLTMTLWGAGLRGIPLHHHHGDVFTWFLSWNQMAEHEFPFVHDAQFYTIQFQPNKSGTLIESLIWVNDSAKPEGEVFARI
ncbi:beta-lactamase/transpeptidase-like protein [Trichoderma sp. SZMC 28015]